VVDGLEQSGQEVADMQRARECPVPKPTGLIGQLLGFDKRDTSSAVPVVKVEKYSRRIRHDEKLDDSS
jgi:cytochrome c oxidase assembly factor 2